MSLLPFFSMVDRRKSLHKDVIEGCADSFPETLRTEIPYSSIIERMTLRRAPLPAYSPGSDEGRAYAELWQEVASHLASLFDPERR